MTVQPGRAPQWLRPLVDAASLVRAGEIGPARRVPPEEGGRPAAVLIALGDELAHGPDVLLVERASTLREHAGQVAFPGGGSDPEDADAIATALREAEEETGLDPAGVVPIAELPDLFIPPSGFVVTPVIAHWERPSAVHAVDFGETAAVVRVPLAELAEPANRFTVTHPSGYSGPGFAVCGLFVWGFTGGLLEALLDLGGWARPWDRGTTRTLEDGWTVARAAHARRQEVADT